MFGSWFSPTLRSVRHSKLSAFASPPTVNRHDGQGTASITVEFENSFLELMWPDATVSVAPGFQRGAEKFRQRMLWRTSGWSPIGIVMRRVASAPAGVSAASLPDFPLPT